MRASIHAERQVQRPFGRPLAALGILVALLGKLTPGAVQPASPGTLLGAFGYVLGARKLATAAVVLSVAEILTRLATNRAFTAKTWGTRRCW